MPNVSELQIVNDFLTAVASKLNGNTNIDLNEAEILLSISAITLLCREKAEKQGTQFQVEFDSAFAEMFKHLDSATRTVISEQLGMLDPTPGTLRIVADAIVNAFCIAGRSIGSAIASAFNHVVAFVKTAWNWTVEKAAMIYNYLTAKGSEAYTWLRDTAAPFVGNKMVQAYDWSRNQVVSIARFSWSLLAKTFDLVKSAFQSILNVLGNILHSIDQKLGAWCAPGVIRQSAMLTKDCRISLEFSIVGQVAGATYISVVLQTAADMVRLKAEIAGCGVLL